MGKDKGRAPARACARPMNLACLLNATVADRHASALSQPSSVSSSQLSSDGAKKEENGQSSDEMSHHDTRNDDDISSRPQANRTPGFRASPPVPTKAPSPDRILPVDENLMYMGAQAQQALRGLVVVLPNSQAVSGGSVEQPAGERALMAEEHLRQQLQLHEMQQHQKLYWEQHRQALLQMQHQHQQLHNLMWHQTAAPDFRTTAILQAMLQPAAQPAGDAATKPKEGKIAKRRGGGKWRNKSKWRKYGEKKRVEDNQTTVMRSYFRCKVPGCEARKQVKSGPNGVIQINVIGEHSHELAPVTSSPDGVCQDCEEVCNGECRSHCRMKCHFGPFPGAKGQAKAGVQSGVVSVDAESQALAQAS